jgi:large subunit ribosomal protein L18
MKEDKHQARHRRAQQTRRKIAELRVVRLAVHRSNGHISASTIEPALRKSVKNGGNVEAAAAVGKLIAEKAKALGIEAVAFDRGGYKYHGRVKALAEAAREHGLKF